MIRSQGTRILIAQPDRERQISRPRAKMTGEVGALPFCPNCGRQISEDDRFCRSCGASINVEQAPSVPPPSAPYVAPIPATAYIPPPPPTPTPAPTAGERVICTVRNLMKPKSLGRWDTYNIVVTDRRMIFALMTGDMIKAAANEAQERGKSEEKGFMQRWAAQMSAGMNYAERYMGMEPEGILRENPGNFAVDNLSVRSIRIRDKNERNRSVYEVEIEAGGNRYKFDTNEFPDSTEILKQMFGDRVKASGKGWTIRI